MKLAILICGLLFSSCTMVLAQEPPPDQGTHTLEEIYQLPLCGTDDEGYVGEMWLDDDKTQIISTLSWTFPPTEETAYCIIHPRRRVIIEPPEKEA